MNLPMYTNKPSVTYLVDLYWRDVIVAMVDFTIGAHGSVKKGI